MTSEARGIHGMWQALTDTSARMWILYLTAYLVAGAIAQATADYTRVARFAHDWQVITLYGGWLVPISLAVRKLPWFDQYAYAVVAIAPIDIVGFALRTSLPYADNFFDRTVGLRSFTLAFVLCAGVIPLVGNLVLKRVLAPFEHRDIARSTSSSIC